jgi:hypothetical protein
MSPSDSFPQQTVPAQAEATDDRADWPTAADVYFRQLSSVDSGQSVAAHQNAESAADSDQILPEIGLNIAIMPEWAVV